MALYHNLASTNPTAFENIIFPTVSSSTAVYRSLYIVLPLSSKLSISRNPSYAVHQLYVTRDLTTQIPSQVTIGCLLLLLLRSSRPQVDSTRCVFSSSLIPTTFLTCSSCWRSRPKVSTPAFLKFRAETFSSNSWDTRKHPISPKGLHAYLVDFAEGETGRLGQAEVDPDDAGKCEAGPKESRVLLPERVVSKEHAFETKTYQFHAVGLSM